MRCMTALAVPLHRLSRSISSYFGAIHSQNVCCRLKSRKIHKKPLFWGSKSFKIIDVDKSKKPVTSACNYVQHVCTYLQQFSH